MSKRLWVVIAVAATIGVLLYLGVLVPRPTGLPGNPQTTAPAK